MTASLSRRSARGKMASPSRPWPATVVLVQTPNGGDDVQGLKAGILEVADCYVVNKAELPGAEAMLEDLREVAEAARHDAAWARPVVATTAHDGSGVPALAEAIEAHRRYLDDSPEGAATGSRAGSGRKCRRSSTTRCAARSTAISRRPRTLQPALQALTTGKADPISLARSLLAARGWMPTRSD